MVLNLAKIAVSCQDCGCLCKILVFSWRSHLSRQGLASLGARDCAEIFSPQKILSLITEISRRSRLTRQDLTYLSEITTISARSCWNFLLAKNLTKISVILLSSYLSRREIVEISLKFLEHTVFGWNFSLRVYPIRIKFTVTQLSTQKAYKKAECGTRIKIRVGFCQHLHHLTKSEN